MGFYPGRGQEAVNPLDTRPFIARGIGGIEANQLL
jgi:hypothetical protein